MVPKQRKKNFWLLTINDNNGLPRVKKLRGTDEHKTFLKKDEMRLSSQTMFMYDSKRWKIFVNRVLKHI